MTLWVADEVNELVQPDFVQFAGDYVQHARESEWKLFQEAAGKLKVPFHALVGDPMHVGIPTAAPIRRG